jgi:hypothetical protein
MEFQITSVSLDLFPKRIRQNDHLVNKSILTNFLGLSRKIEGRNSAEKVIVLELN